MGIDLSNILNFFQSHYFLAKPMALGKEMSPVAIIFLIMLISADARVLLQNQESQKSFFLQGATIARVTPGGPDRQHNHYLQPFSERKQGFHLEDQIVNTITQTNDMHQPTTTS